MKKVFQIGICIIILLMSSFARGEGSLPRRIVSLSPAVTEMLFELGLGSRVAGVTDYCFYPDEVDDKLRVGGYLDTNYEAIIFLKPDLVVSPTEYDDEIKKLFEATEVDFMTVDTRTVEGILESMMAIGSKCGVEDRAESVVEEKRGEIAAAGARARRRPSKRIMIVVGREKGSLEEVYIAGKSTFYNDLLEILNCENVYGEDGISYPTISVEAIMRFNPDIIIEMAPNQPEAGTSGVAEEWRSLGTVNAVRNDDIYVLNGDYVSIPGPRFTLILKDIEGAL